MARKQILRETAPRDAVTIEVLIVDDDGAIAGVLDRSLTAHGYLVRLAASGNDALAAITSQKPDLLLLDVNLPDITGWDVMRRLAPETRRVLPIIVFSASPPSRSRIQELHPEGVLLKPFPMDALVRLIGDLTNRQAIEQDSA